MLNPDVRNRRIEPDEAMKRRICAAVADGHTNEQLTSRFKMSEERILGIAKAGGVERPSSKDRQARER